MSTGSRGILLLPEPYDLRAGRSQRQPQRQPLSHLPRLLRDYQEENETNFNYNSLQAGIRFENKHGLTTQLAYTWSHNISIVSNDLNGLSDPFNPRYDTGSDTGFDRRHIFNASYVYNLPFGRMAACWRATRSAAGPFPASLRPKSGVPLYITYTGPKALGLGGGTNNRPNLVAKVTYPKTVGEWFSQASYYNKANPIATNGDPLAPWNGGTNQGFGTAGKDSALGPGIINWNLSLFKAIPLNENGTRVELRFESFNTFNHTIFQNIDTGSHDGNFGAVTSDYGPRTMELGGKFVF